MKFKVDDRVEAMDDMYFAKKDPKERSLRISVKLENIEWDENVGDDTIGNIEHVRESSEDRRLRLIEDPKSYELHIICKDGVTTNCVYKEDNKIVNKSSTKRNIQYDEFDFKTAVQNCVNRVFDKESTSKVNKNLTGKRVMVKSVPDNQIILCADDYIGKCGVTMKTANEPDTYIINFDIEYMNIVDATNHFVGFTSDNLVVID